MRVAHDGFAVVVNYAGSTAIAEGPVNEINGVSHFTRGPGLSWVVCKLGNNILDSFPD